MALKGKMGPISGEIDMLFAIWFFRVKKVAQWVAKVARGWFAHPAVEQKKGRNTRPGFV